MTETCVIYIVGGSRAGSRRGRLSSRRDLLDWDLLATLSSSAKRELGYLVWLTFFSHRSWKSFQSTLNSSPCRPLARILVPSPLPKRASQPSSLTIFLAASAVFVFC